MKGLIFQEKVFPVDLPPACFQGSVCNIPGRDAVYPPEVQFTPRKILRYLTLVMQQLSSCQNIQTAAVTETPLSRGISVNIKATSI